MVKVIGVNMFRLGYKMFTNFMVFVTGFGCGCYFMKSSYKVDLGETNLLINSLKQKYLGPKS